jgi:hypothetical protein
LPGAKLQHSGKFFPAIQANYCNLQKKEGGWPVLVRPHSLKNEMPPCCDKFSLFLSQKAVPQNIVSADPTDTLHVVTLFECGNSSKVYLFQPFDDYAHCGMVIAITL